MKQKEIKRQNFDNAAIILLLATVLVKLIGALFKIPLSSDAVLGDLGFGYFACAHDIFVPIYTLAISGFPVAISRIIADFAAQNRWQDIKSVLRVFKGLFLSVGFIVSILMIVLAFPFVRLTDESGQSIYSLLAIAPSFVLCCAVSVYRGYFEGLHNMTIAAISNIIEALVKLVFGLGLAIITLKFTSNLAYAAAAAIIGISLGTLASLVYLYISFKISGGILRDTEQTDGLKKFDVKELLKLTVYISVPIALSSMSSSIVSLIDAITVRWQLSGMDLTGAYSTAITENLNNSSNLSVSEILPTFLYGIRSKAFTIYNLIPTLTVAVGVSAIPVLTESFTNKNADGIKENVQSVLKFSSIITFPAAAGFIAIGNKILALLFGEGISAEIGGKMLLIYGIAVLFSGLAIPLTCVLQALDCQKKALYNVLIGIIVKLVLNLILCQNIKMNIFGAVVSTAVCNLIILALNIKTLIKLIGPVLNVKHNLCKPFSAAVLCGITAYGISLISNSRLTTAIAIVVAAVVYMFFLVQFSIFSEQEILKLPMGKALLKVYKAFKLKKTG